MTISLGGIVLDDHLLLDGLEISKDVAISTVVTLGGLAVSQTMPLTGGRLLSLVALREGNSLKGKFLRHQLMAIKALATLGQEETLVHHMGTFSVLIVSTAEITPVKKYRNPQDDDWLHGPIQLIEV